MATQRGGTTEAHRRFRDARDALLAARGDYESAYEKVRWPQLDEFNWALDWFDAIADDRPALWIVEADGGEQQLSFAELSARSSRLANWLRAQGRRPRRPGDPDAREPARALGDRARRKDEAARVE